jgi:hypothetical protein
MRNQTKGARDWFDRIRKADPTPFAHWLLRQATNIGSPVDSRGSYTLLLRWNFSGQLDKPPSGVKARRFLESAQPRWFASGSPNARFPPVADPRQSLVALNYRATILWHCRPHGRRPATSLFPDPAALHRVCNTARYISVRVGSCARRAAIGSTRPNSMAGGGIRGGS